MYVKAHILSWLANADTQTLIDLEKYIVCYACKGALSTEELITIFKELVDSSDSTATVKSVTNKLLMMINVPEAAVDFLNAGGKPYHTTTFS